MNTRVLLQALAVSAGIVLAAPAIGQRPALPDISVAWEPYGPDHNGAQLLELAISQDAKSHFVEVGGNVYEDMPVLLAFSAAKADVRFPWGDVLLIDPLQTAVILTVTPCPKGAGSESGCVRFEVEALRHVLPVKFYLQAFSFDVSMQYPFLTSYGLEVTCQLMR